MTATTGQIKSISDRLANWSILHSFVILLSAGLMWLTGIRVYLLAGAVFSFAVLIYTGRNVRINKARFGLANLFTLARLTAVFFIVLFFPEISHFTLALLGLMILLGDGIDGWLARKYNEISEFGEFLDKETDAFFMLVLCLAAVQEGLAWNWIVFLGLLRYLFGIFLFLYKTDVKKERRSQAGRTIYVFVVCTLLSAFLPFGWLTDISLVFSALLLIYSFGRDILWILFEKSA